MNDYELNKVRETFSRLFVIAKQANMNLDSFTYMLSRSDFIKYIEKDKFDEDLDLSLQRQFMNITGFTVLREESYGVYDDAYWVGQSYFDLHYKVNKSFSYIFLKLPSSKLIDLYNVYHEMDISQLVEYFNEIDKKKTILRLLCNQYKKSLTDINKATGISINTLKKYNSSDESLLNASFQNVSKLVEYFDLPYSLFINKINGLLKP